MKVFSPYIVLVRYIKILVIMSDEIYILAKSSLKSSENSILVQTLFFCEIKKWRLEEREEKEQEAFT